VWTSGPLIQSQDPPIPNLCQFNPIHSYNQLFRDITSYLILNIFRTLFGRKIIDPWSTLHIAP
jgi:hypothetical protein